MRRLLMFVAVGGLVLPFAACGGDDGKDNDKAGDDPTSVATDTDKKTDHQVAAKTAECDAQVSTTGEYAADWQGDAQVRTGGHGIDAPGPAAVYTLTDKPNRILIYSPGKDFVATISLSADGVFYASDPAESKSLDIDEDGKYASVDTTLTSTGGAEIGLVAEFTCGESKK